MVAQRPPFKGNNVIETQAKIFHRNPEPPTKSNPDIPSELEAICLKALQKEKDKRFQDVKLMKEAISDFLLNKPKSKAQKITQWLKKFRR
jgi:serine/threonine-protein kinase